MQEKLKELKEPENVIEEEVDAGQSTYVRQRKNDRNTMQTPLMSLKEGMTYRHNLGSLPTSLSGRDEVLQSIVENLATGTDPISLNGTRGIGKTSLAKKAAIQCLENGTFDLAVFVDYSVDQGKALIHLNSILDTIIRTSGMCEWLTKEIDIQKKRSSVIDQILSKVNCILIFDNFEVGSSGLLVEEASAFVEFLCGIFYSNSHKTASIDRKAVIITTHEEADTITDAFKSNVFSLAPLSFQASKTLMENKLFSPRSPRLQPTEQEMVYKIAKGNPALIEFTIGQAKYLGFEKILNKYENYYIPLENAEDDQTYGFLFELAWNEIFDPLHRNILMVLTLFHEAATSEAITNILEEGRQDIQEDSIIRHLEELLILGLVELTHYESEVVWNISSWSKRMSQMRMLEETDFANTLKCSFVTYYLDFAKCKPAEGTAIIQTEVNNLIEAIELATQLEMWNQLVETTNSINNFFWLTGYWPERVRVGRILLEACRVTGNDVVRARILVNDLGFTFLRFEELERAEQYAKVGLAMYQKSNDQKGMALATRHLAKVSLLMGEYEYMKPDLTWSDYFELAQDLYTESLEIRETLARNDEKQEITVADLKLDFGRLCWLWGRKCEQTGRVTKQRKVIEKAAELYEQAIDVTKEGLVIFEKHEDNRGIAKAYGNLGNAFKELARFYRRENQDERSFNAIKTAENWYTQSLEIAQKIPKVDEIAHAKWGLAETYELRYEIHLDKFHLHRALIFATESNELYGRMATPGDFEATRILKERLEGI